LPTLVIEIGAFESVFTELSFDRFRQCDSESNALTAFAFIAQDGLVRHPAIEPKLINN
jgi:hypothetical protein